MWKKNLNWNGLWPFTIGWLKVNYSIVGQNQKLNIAQIFPLTMYPIVWQCFASLTLRNVRKRSTSVFSVKKINVFPPCILLGKDARPPMKSSDRERAFITVGNCNFDHCQSTPKNYHYCLGSTHTAADKQIKRRRKNSGRLFMWYPVFHPKNSYCCEVDVFIPSVGVWNSRTILCSPFSVARTELKGAIKLDPT